MYRLLFGSLAMLILVVSFSGCSSKQKASDNSYERANKAAEKAHIRLDKE